MGRRIVPGMFWVGCLVCALLLLAGTMRASGPSNRPPDVRGLWDGFFLADDGTTGRVNSVITQQDFRRLAGDGVLLGLEGSGQFNAYNFSATVVPPDFLTGTGVARTGRLVFQAGLATYPGLGGDAGVMAPEYHFVPSRSGASRVSALLLHSFPAVDPPDIAGTGEGPFISVPDPITGAPADPSFMGFGRLQIDERNDHGYFAGRVVVFLGSNPDPFLSWPFLATASDDRRVLGISQGRFGRIIYNGAIVPAPDTQSSFSMDGTFRLLLNDGRSLFNAINVNFARVIE
jgi:hypothetical protein